MYPLGKWGFAPSVRRVLGTSAGVSTGVYTTIINILIESCTLYAVAFLAYLGRAGYGHDYAHDLLSPLLLSRLQVRTAFPVFYPLQSSNDDVSLQLAGDHSIPHHCASCHWESSDK